MPDTDDVMAGIGLAVLTVGVCLVFVPAGLIVLGGTLMGAAFLRARGRS